MTQYRALAGGTGLAIVGFLSLIYFGPTYAGQSTPVTADAAFERFWVADSPEEAADRVDAILKSGVTFEDAYDRLAAGRIYAAQESGVVMRTNRMDRVDHYYAVTVPSSYDPEKRYPVRFQLHGGVGGRATNQPRGNGAMTRCGTFRRSSTP